MFCVLRPQLLCIPHPRAGNPIILHCLVIVEALTSIAYQIHAKHEPCTKSCKIIAYLSPHTSLPPCSPTLSPEDFHLQPLQPPTHPTLQKLQKQCKFFPRSSPGGSPSFHPLALKLQCICGGTPSNYDLISSRQSLKRGAKDTSPCLSISSSLQFPVFHTSQENFHPIAPEP